MFILLSKFNEKWRQFAFPLHSVPQNKNQRITKVGAELKQKRAHKVWSGKIGNDTFNHEIKPTNNIKTNPNKNTKPKHHLSHFNSFHSRPSLAAKQLD